LLKLSGETATKAGFRDLAGSPPPMPITVWVEAVGQLMIEPTDLAPIGQPSHSDALSSFDIVGQRWSRCEGLP
jgi:hypothetical protein